MPTKKKYTPKHLWKKKMRKKRNAKLPKSLFPNVYYFNRSQVFNVNLGTLTDTQPQGLFWNYVDENTGGGDGRRAAVAQLKFNLQQVTDWVDFQRLFTYFKIPAVSFKVYCSTGIGGGSTRDNSQCLVYTMPYAVPIDDSSPPIPPTELVAQTREEKFLCSQVCRKKLLLNNDTAKPNINMFMKLKQAGETYDTSVNVPFMMRPKWIPFDAGADPQLTQHYGLLQRIQPVNDTSLPNVSMKCVVKYYIMCKRVR